MPSSTLLDLRDQLVCTIADRPDSRVGLAGVSPTLIELVAWLRSVGHSPGAIRLFDRSVQHIGRTFGSTIIESLDELDRTLDVLVVCLDAEKEAVLNAVPSELTGLKILMSGHAHLQPCDARYLRLRDDGLVNSRAGGYELMLFHIYEAVQHIVRCNIPGDFVEFGVYKGGTTGFLCRLLDDLDRPGRLIAFDSFCGFPGRRHVLDLYQDDQDEFGDFEAVRRWLAHPRIELIEGDIRETAVQMQGRSMR